MTFFAQKSASQVPGPAWTWIRAVLLGLIGAVPAWTTASPHVEEFNATTYRDSANTTADWNTVAGKLQLFPFRPTLSGTYDSPGTARGVVIAGSTAYVADDASGLQILNITNPASPVFLGTYNTPGTANGVAVSGTLAYVADGNSGLEILNVSNPASPTLLGSFNTSGTSRGVAISGTFAYVADGNSGLQIFNVSNPASPALVGTYNTPGTARGVVVSGTVAYVADDASGLQIINVSNPASPSLLGAYDTPNSAQGVDVSGSVAFVADGTTGLQVINVSNPASPSLLGSYDTPSNARGVAVASRVAYVADDLSGFHLINVANPASPSLIGSFDTAGTGLGVAVRATLAYVADGTSGLQVINVGTAVNASVLGGYDTPDNAHGAAISGTVACVADNNSGLQIVNVSNPASPTLLASYDTPSFVDGVAISGTTAYLAAGTSGLQVLNISNPASPVLLGAYDSTGSARDVAVSGTTAYVANSTSGLQLISVANPASPGLLGSYDTPGSARGVALRGTTAYVADGTSGLQILNVSNPASPTLLGTYDTPGSAEAVAVSGTVAYVADGPWGLQILNVSNPASPTLLGSFAPATATGIAIFGTTVLLANGVAGLEAFDVSNPASAMFLGTYDTPGNALAVAVSGGLAYVADGSSGLQIMELMQNRFDLARNVGRSRTISNGEWITQAQIHVIQVDDIGWELSANGGVDWQDATADGGWVSLTPGTDLRWRATLVPRPPVTLALPPEVSRLEITYQTALGALHCNDANGTPLQSGSKVVVRGAVAGNFPIGSDSRLYLDDGSGGIQVLGPPQLCAAVGDSVEVTGTVVGSNGLTQITAPGLSIAALSGSSVFLPIALNPSDVSGTFQGGCEPNESRLLTVSGVYIRTSSGDMPNPTDSFVEGTPYRLINAGPDSTTNFCGMRVVGPSNGCGFVNTLIGQPISLSEVDVTGLLSQFDTTDPRTSDYELWPRGVADLVEQSTVDAPITQLPRAFGLSPSQPNPFSNRTGIGFDVPRATRVTLQLYDVSGRLVRTLTDRQWPAGRHRLEWDGTTNQGSPARGGVYFCRMEAGEFRSQQSMVRLTSRP